MNEQETRTAWQSKLEELKGAARGILPPGTDERDINQLATGVNLLGSIESTAVYTLALRMLDLETERRVKTGELPSHHLGKNRAQRRHR